MQTFTEIFNILLSIGVFLYTVLLLIALYYRLKLPIKYSSFITIYGVRLVLCISAVASVMSLIYSNVIGFPPCDLCWYQRIFMYSLFIFSFTGFLKKESFNTIKVYLQTFILCGFLIALFHTIVYYTGINPLPCSAAASCTARYVFEFGFVTIPLMSLISFILLYSMTLSKK